MSSELERLIGYNFQDENFLTRSVFSRGNDFKRLELLGDSILSFTIIDHIQLLFPNASGGELAVRHNHLVCGETITSIARKNNLDFAIEKVLKTSVSDKVLENTIESLIGAIYIDSENLNKAKKFIFRFWNEIIGDDVAIDSKTLLQEYLQSKGIKPPEYKVVDSSGSDHTPVFTVRAFSREHYGQASAGSIKAAEKKAAKELLNKLKKIYQ